MVLSKIINMSTDITWAFGIVSINLCYPRQSDSRTLFTQLCIMALRAFYFTASNIALAIIVNMSADITGALWVFSINLCYPRQAFSRAFFAHLCRLAARAFRIAASNITLFIVISMSADITWTFWVFSINLFYPSKPNSLAFFTPLHLFIVHINHLKFSIIIAKKHSGIVACDCWVVNGVALFQRMQGFKRAILLLTGDVDWYWSGGGTCHTFCKALGAP